MTDIAAERRRILEQLYGSPDGGPGVDPASPQALVHPVLNPASVDPSATALDSLWAQFAADQAKVHDENMPGLQQALAAQNWIRQANADRDKALKAQQGAGGGGSRDGGGGGGTAPTYPSYTPPQTDYSWIDELISQGYTPPPRLPRSTSSNESGAGYSTAGKGMPAKRPSTPQVYKPRKGEGAR